MAIATFDGSPKAITIAPVSSKATNHRIQSTCCWVGILLTSCLVVSGLTVVCVVHVLDSDECSDRSCLHGATCVDKLNGYKCLCVDGYDGDFCEIEIDECSDHSCLHGATCVDKLNGYRCLCVDGYDSDFCEIELDECSNHSCLHGATCVDKLNGYECLCVDGYDGDFCEIEIDECSSHSCLHGATCVDKLNGYKCLCVDGYDGDFCGIEIDECSDHSCLHGATCADKLNGHQCLCVDGYYGDFCEIEIDECSDHSCLHGATCVDKLNGYRCLCVDGYHGDLCEIDTDECASQPCANGGTCVDGINSFSCECMPGNDGKQCDIVTDICLLTSPCTDNWDCLSDPLLYTCLTDPQLYTCQCPTGYAAPDCRQTCFNMTVYTGEVTSLTAGGVSKDVYLETTEPGSSPWIVVVRRQDNSTEFVKRYWADYKNGFGQLTGEFYLGNDFVHLLTSNGSAWEARFDLMTETGDCLWAEYCSFGLAPESDRYRLTLAGHDPKSTADDQMHDHHNGQPFSTMDRDNDDSSRYNCALKYHGGWWYRDCYTSKLTSKYGPGEGHGYSISWAPHVRLPYADLKIRPRV